MHSIFNRERQVPRAGSTTDNLASQPRFLTPKSGRVMCRTTWFRSFVVAIVLLAGPLLIIPTGADATSGTLRITNDTILTTDHAGNVVIGNSGVTLDCAGHEITGA